MKNLHNSVTVDEDYEFFGLRHTAYPSLASGEQFVSANVTAPGHICEETLTLNGLEFNENPFALEMAKSPMKQSSNSLQLPKQPTPL